MKLFVVLGLSLAAVAVQVDSVDGGVDASLMHKVLHAKWSAFKAKHSKNYADHEEEEKKKNFLEHTHTIESHNARFYAGLESYELAHNKMSDMSMQEIMATRMGVNMPADAKERFANVSLHEVPARRQMPKEFDWRKLGAVSPIRDQGGCGGCYAFSAAGALETAHWRMNGKLPDISEQDLIDCTTEYGNLGCTGGWMHTAFQWLRDHSGYIADDKYPYKASEGTCQHESKPKMSEVLQFYRIKEGDETALLHAVTSIGTVSVAFNAGNSQFAHYNRGIFDTEECKEIPTHAVLVVGFGTEGGVDYWIIKNSWGSDWGEQGYFRMRRGRNLCGIATWASYPLVSRVTDSSQ